MSTRAIAPIVGVDRKTVERDVRGGTNVPPAPVPREVVTVTPETVTADPDTGEGMSTRAIAPIVGVTRQMVSKDLAASGGNQVATSEAEPREVVEVITADAQTGEVIDDEVGIPDTIDPSAPRTVTGLDGKT
ncbi:MAG: hypothetical protein ACTHX2_14475 [Microbacterium sp.]